MYARQEYLRLVRYYDAITLNRPGYWGCMECSAHNPDMFPFCMVCGAKRWFTDMPTQLISVGPVTPLIQNQIYALPAARCLLFCDVAAATFEQSNVVTMVPAVALTPDANEQIECGGGFIRCTSGNVNVRLTKA